MDGQVTAGTLVCAIPKAALLCWLRPQLAELCRSLTEVAVEVLKSGVSAADVHQFECRVEEIMRELARSFQEWYFSSLEPSDVEAMPPRIAFLGQSYQRLRKKTPHPNVLTRFGNIRLTRAIYRQGSGGRTIAPLEHMLGIQCGATPGARDLVGRQSATAGSCTSATSAQSKRRTGKLSSAICMWMADESGSNASLITTTRVCD